MWWWFGGESQVAYDIRPDGGLDWRNGNDQSGVDAQLRGQAGLLLAQATGVLALGG
jgi:hypothetical protein